MARCQICGKGRVVGRTQRHRRGVAGAQWLRRAQKKVKFFKPNLHTAWVAKNGKRVRLRLCTKCLRKVKREVPKVPQVSKVSKVQESPVPQSV